MITVIAGGLIFAAMTYIGILIKKQYALRLKFLSYISDFSSYMLREVTLYKSPIENIIDKFTIDKSKDHKMLLEYKELSLDRSYEKLYALSNHIYLKHTDRQLITDFLMNMGKSNLAGEIKYIERFLQEIEVSKLNAKEALHKDGKLASQLCSLIGFALMIIVV